MVVQKGAPIKMKKKLFGAVIIFALAVNAPIASAIEKQTAEATATGSSQLGSSAVLGNLLTDFDREQGVFSYHMVFRILSKFVPGLTDRQRDAFRYGPTTAEQAQACKDRHADTIAAGTDAASLPCSMSEISYEEYSDAHRAIGAALSLSSDAFNKPEKPHAD